MYNYQIEKAPCPRSALHVYNSVSYHPYSFRYSDSVKFGQWKMLQGNKHKEQHPKHPACRIQPRRQCRVLPRSAGSARNQAFSVAETLLVEKQHTYLSTFNNQFVTFVPEEGVNGIYVGDSGKVPEKSKTFSFISKNVMVIDKVFLYRYASSIPEDTSGEGWKYEVKLRLKENENFWLHCNKQNQAVEIKKFEESERLPEQTSFLLHYKTSEYVSFECKSNRGTFIAVSGDHLQLVQPNGLTEEKTLFKLAPSQCLNVLEISGS
ncbi:PREDICTED: interleukin-33 [Elephantulus edwardii]|uniref:interleukin-33 n=1 Tax=Elephantulus edwardii TaxID=28737 RepID=UPI0003F0D1EA|nr:PREDICTED: interleukin-33 [Elephantulus edwardii]